ncbi:protein lethal(2)essential for life [Nephila pilipes]|uniref:Protein lethal(2)essential for life n=1 Tax=Nephila pilipes TaxID=299642 RepID=A0A8X6PU71_NEPPI|nr:protein lethal(2)essential for life [Nephila pilipes]
MSDQHSEPGFETKLNISDFSPEEVTVHADDRYVTITAEHEERRGDSGYVARHFIRRFLLPDNVASENLSTHLSSDGILTVQAPLRDSVKHRDAPEALRGSTKEPTESHTTPEDQEQSTQNETRS